MSDPYAGLRLSDAEREAAAAELGEHYAEGRLDHDEHGERLDAVWAAKVRRDLPPLFADLPSRYAVPAPVAQPGGPAVWRAAGAGPPAPPRRRWHQQLPAPLLVLLVVLAAVLVVAHLPVFLLAGVLFLLVRHRRRQHGTWRGGQHPGAHPGWR